MSQLSKKKDSIIERMYTVDSFTQAFASTCLGSQTLTTNDMQVLLKYLQRDKRVLLRDGDVSRVDLLDWDRARLTVFGLVCRLSKSSRQKRTSRRVYLKQREAYSKSWTRASCWRNRLMIWSIALRSESRTVEATVPFSLTNQPFQASRKDHQVYQEQSEEPSLISFTQQESSGRCAIKAYYGLRKSACRTAQDRICRVGYGYSVRVLECHCLA